MIAGKPKNECDEIVHALRLIDPEIGFRMENEKIVLMGKGMECISNAIDILSRIKKIAVRNKFCTEADLVLKTNAEAMTDHSDISPLACINYSQDFCSTCEQKMNDTWNCLGCPVA